MNIPKLFDRKKQWSAQGQQRVIEIRSLESQLATTDALISAAEKAVAEWEEHKVEVVGNAVHDNLHSTLNQRFIQAEAEKAKLAVYRESKARLEERLKALSAPSKDRTEQQDRLAALALERLSKDEAIDAAVSALGKLVEERGELTSRMEEAASAIGMSFTWRHFDAERFTTLVGSLPKSALASESSAWVDWFLGRQTKGPTKPYGVKRDIKRAETLADPGVLFEGDEVDLTEQEAAEILRENPPKGDAWKVFQPAIIDLDVLYGRAESKN